MLATINCSMEVDGLTYFLLKFQVWKYNNFEIWLICSYVYAFVIWWQLAQVCATYFPVPCPNVFFGLLPGTSCHFIFHWSILILPLHMPKQVQSICPHYFTDVLASRFPVFHTKCAIFEFNSTSTSTLCFQRILISGLYPNQVILYYPHAYVK